MTRAFQFVRNMKRQYQVALTIIALYAAFVGYRTVQTWYYIWEYAWLEGENVPYEQIAVLEKLRSLGDRAVDPILSTILDKSPWSTSTLGFDSVLTQAGHFGHARVLLRLSGERDTTRKIYLVYLLQACFGDFSCLNIWVDSLRMTSHDANRLRVTLVPHFPDVPFVLKGKEFNPEFLDWYHRHFPNWWRASLAAPTGR